MQLADLQRKARWNDPDFLLAGDSALGQDEIQSQMLLWATMAAPLISSTDLTKISPAALAVLGNTDVIAVDQDPLGLQGQIVQQDTGSDVLSKPLANGDRAVALFNSSDEARTISTTAAAAGLPVESSYLLKDLVGKQVRQSIGAISANVRPQRHRAAAGPPGRREGDVAVDDDHLEPAVRDTASTWRVGLTDNGSSALADVEPGRTVTTSTGQRKRTKRRG